MKKILSILAFVASSVSVFAQAGTDRVLYENTSGTAAGVYTVDALKTYINTGVGSGTVTSASVVSANGFAGTVATPTTTPAITVTTTVTGVLKGNGTAISAATAGTDYVIPSGNITGTSANVTGTVAVANGGSGATTLTGVLKGNGTSAFTAATAGTDYVIPSGNITGTSANVTGTVAISNGGTGSTTQNFVDLSTTQATIGGAKTFTAAGTFSGGLTSSGATTLSGVYTKTSAATIVITPATAITATGNIAAAGGVTPVNSASAIVLTIPSGFTIGTEKEFQLARTSTGQVTFTASGTETLNGGSAAGSFVVGANSQGATVKLYKVSSTDWSIGLRW